MGSRERRRARAPREERNRVAVTIPRDVYETLNVDAERRGRSASSQVEVILRGLYDLPAGYELDGSILRVLDRPAAPRVAAQPGGAA